MSKYVIPVNERCPECGAPKKTTATYDEEKVVTGKGKIKKEPTGRTINEWYCDRCGNSGYEYE